ncbi:MAG: HAMP domain-containing protein [Deltaproteobacteria bacterium]|nr:HAMP domain-containing protein [Deltaproteobacteria bacterium]
MYNSLRARVTLGVLAIMLTLLLVSAVAITTLRRLGGEIETILRENYRSVIACVDMKEALERQDSAALFASTGHDDIARPLLAEQRAAFARAYTVERNNITLPDEGAAVREIDALYRDYVAAVDRALTAPQGPARSEAYFRELLPRFTRLKLATERVLRMNQASMESADRSAKAAARRGVALTVGVGALALLLLIAFTWWLPRMVVRPVQRLADAARAIGGGDLDVTIADPGVRELAPLAEAFRRMVEKLRAYRQSSLGELLAARDLANATVQCLLDPLVVFERDGTVLLTNEAATRVFGVEPGDGPATPGDGALGHVFGAARARAIATGAVVAPGNLAGATRWRDRLGERYFQVRAAPLRAESDDGRVIVVAQDVTRLRRIDRLKSDMVATVSHEFKTPLTSLRMATHLLLEPGTGPLTEAQREVVTTARDDTERLRCWSTSCSTWCASSPRPARCTACPSRSTSSCAPWSTATAPSRRTRASRSSSRAPARCLGRGSTPRSSASCWPTWSPTPSGTRPRGAGSPWPPRPTPRRCASPCATPARGWRRPT